MRNRLTFANIISILLENKNLSDHEHSGLFSPDLSDTIQNSRLPSITEEFVGRKNELKECEKLLQEHPTLFVSGVAGIGKSEFA